MKLKFKWKTFLFWFNSAQAQAPGPHINFSRNISPRMSAIFFKNNKHFDSEVTNKLMTHLWNSLKLIDFPRIVFPTSFHLIHNIIFILNSHVIVHWDRQICTYTYLNNSQIFYISMAFESLHIWLFNWLDFDELILRLWLHIMLK